MKIANRDASSKTSKLEPFRGSNLFAEKEGDFYVVYSYGYHFPLYVMKDFRGFHQKHGAIGAVVVWENMIKRSQSTSRHKTQARPTGNDFVFVESSTADLWETVRDLERSNLTMLGVVDEKGTPSVRDALENLIAIMKEEEEE